MIEGKRVLALIPARKGSKGLPLKNIRPLAGKPLLAWPIEAAKACSLIDRVLISTDDPEFASIAVSYGAEAPFLRPAELASDTAPSIDFILHAIDRLKADGQHFDYLVLLEPTSPLTTADDIEAALLRLHSHRNIADSIVGVTQMISTHPAFAVTQNGNGSLRPYAAESFSTLPRRRTRRKFWPWMGACTFRTPRLCGEQGPSVMTGLWGSKRHGTKPSKLMIWSTFSVSRPFSTILSWFDNLTHPCRTSPEEDHA